MLPTIQLKRPDTGLFVFGDQTSANRNNSTFQIKYRDDPAGFVRECFLWREDEQPSAYQIKALEQIPKRKRVCIRGPHGLGKTALASWVILWFVLTRDGIDDWKAPTTASAWRQLTKFLWPEVRKWAHRLNWDKLRRSPFNERTELISLSVKGQTGEAFALASDNSAMIEGAHASQLLYVFDESREIPPATWDSAEGAFSTGDAYWLAISTPGEPQGRFYEIQSRRPGFEDWLAVHITLEDAIKAGRISRQWAKQRKAQWGEDSAVYKNRVLGEFASSEEDGIIPLSWVERANNRWLEWVDAGKPGQFICQGVDVGRGGDKSVQALRFENAIDDLRRDGKKDVMSITGKAVGVANKYPDGYSVVDVIGVGAGVVDSMREKRLRVIPFNASERCDRKDNSGELGFVNWRAAAWWYMRELLQADIPAIPPDDKLTGDLTAPKWRVMSGGRIQVEAKEEIKKRLGRSTDDGDAVIMAFAPVKPTALPDQPAERSRWQLDEIDDGESRWRRY